MAEAIDLQLDLTRPGFYLRPDYFDVLAELRRSAPVHRALDGSWAVSRYDDIRTISRDPDRFVSGRGVLINDPMRSDGGTLNTFSILHLDPPVHTLYRKIVNRQFTPRAVSRLESTIRHTVTSVLDETVPERPIDGIDDLAAVVPITVIAELLGVGDADRAMFRRWSDAIIASADSDASGSGPEELGQMAEFLLARVDSAASSDESLLGVLNAAELDGRPLNRVEIMGFFMTLLVAGNETTRTLISGGIEALHQHPAQRQLLTDDPSRLPAAVEELLRWVTPIQAFGRTAVVDVELSGVRVPAGDFVVMLYASGNRDESVFGPTAAQLDVCRAVSPTHLAFGFGEHLCLGAALARLEARVFFEELLRRHPGYALTGDADYVRSTLVRGAVRMPMVLDP